jgi:hypothetical protein
MDREQLVDRIGANAPPAWPDDREEALLVLRFVDVILNLPVSEGPKDDRGSAAR